MGKNRRVKKEQGWQEDKRRGGGMEGTYINFSEGMFGERELGGGMGWGWRGRTDKGVTGEE